VSEDVVIRVRVSGVGEVSCRCKQLAVGSLFRSSVVVHTGQGLGFRVQVSCGCT
jgi:hypothetical protein